MSPASLFPFLNLLDRVIYAGQAGKIQQTYAMTVWRMGYAVGGEPC